MTKDFCNKCGACCKHIKADLDAKILYWDGILPLDDNFASMLDPVGENTNIYKCKYLHDNLCTNQAKPDICSNYPKSSFVELPENCGYSGFIFLQAEKIKQKVRKLKEEIIHYNAIITTSKDKKEINQLQKLISSHIKQISKYKDFGSADW